MPFPRTPAARRSRGRRLTASLAALVAVLCLPGAASAAQTPTVTTLPADPSLISDSYALLSGVINPNGVTTSYTFQYGKTTAYGSATPVTSAGNGKADVPVDVSLDDLKPATTYHFRLVAIPGGPGADAKYGGEIFGGDQSFKTAPALNVKFASGKAKVKKKRARVKLKGVGPAGDVARGKLTLSVKVKGKKRKVGSASYRVGVGKTKTIKVRLNRRARGALAASPKHRLKVFASAKTKGRRTAVKKKLTLVG